MARTNTTKPGLEKQPRDRVFSSPVALAFVRTVVERRGVTEAQARKIYLDYVNRAGKPRQVA